MSVNRPTARRNDVKSKIGDFVRMPRPRASTPKSTIYFWGQTTGLWTCTNAPNFGRFLRFRVNRALKITNKNRFDKIRANVRREQLILHGLVEKLAKNRNRVSVQSCTSEGHFFRKTAFWRFLRVNRP